ncbi:MAG: hypothetical protein V4722_28175 [Bacteroidota bacterium]
MKVYKRVIQIELNELSKAVIDQLVAKNKLPIFGKINKNWQYLTTTSENDYENLEPWIQWVTVHTGKSYDEHQIFTLSDVHKLKHTQIWEELSRNGIESGIIGSMNIIRRDTKGGTFFPDPWAIYNETYPESLRPLWDLISNRVQGHATKKITFGDIRKGLKACLSLGLSPTIYFKMAKQILAQKLNPKTKWKLACVFDEFLAEIFIRILKKTNYGFYTLFLNAIAHYQHHYWRAFDIKPFKPDIKYDDINEDDDPVMHGYEVYDRILKRVLDELGNDPDTLIIIVSALSQVPYTAKDSEGGMNYYRLNDHKAFAESIGLPKNEFEIFPLMSRDWQVQYKNEAARQKALGILTHLKVDGHTLFNIRENTDGFIFVETAYTMGISDSSEIKNSGGETICRFKDVFTNIAIKSGHHSGIGNLWISDAGVIGAGKGREIPLGQLYDVNLQAFGLAKKPMLQNA